MKKPGIAIAFGMGPKEEEDEDEVPEEQLAAAEALRKALKSGDDKSVAMAFKAMMTCCEGDEEE